MHYKRKIFCGLIAALMMSGGVRAASNGCDKDGADYINPSLALCTTHVYNVGHAQNLGDSAQRQAMQEVIAIKTTVMTQQMFKQYEYLNATIRRLKTQLEKAVLTTSLQAAGAASEGASGAVASKDRSIIISGTQNCIDKLNQSSVLECLQSNLMYIRTAANSGKYGDAKRQLDVDIKAFNTWFRDKPYAYKKDGKDAPITATKSVIDEVINEFNVTVSVTKENLNRENMRLNTKVNG